MMKVAVFPNVGDMTNRNGTLQGLRLLLVEDNDTFRDLLSELLRDRGAIVVQAAGLRQAETLLQELHPHVVLCDLKLADGTSDSLPA